jgi:hypothetical protein
MRRVLKKFSFTILIVLLSGAIFWGHSYFTRSFRSFILTSLKNVFKTEDVYVGYAGLGIPLNLELRDIKIKNAITIQRVNIYPNPATMLFKNKIIATSIKITGPVVNYNEIKKEPFYTNTGEKINLSFCFSKIIVENGRFFYALDDGKLIDCCRIKCILEGPGIYFTNANTFVFKAMGFLKNHGTNFLSPFQANGVVTKKGIAKIKLRATDVDCESLGPIYTRYLKGIVTKARVDFYSNMLLSSRGLNAKCYLKSEKSSFAGEQLLKITEPLAVSFILGVDFTRNIVKIRSLHTNLLNIFSGIS